MTSRERFDTSAPVHPEPTFGSRTHPAREHVVRTLTAGVIVIALAALSATLMEHPGWSLPAFVVLVLALNRYFLPSRFTIDDDGITARYPLRRMRYRWDDLRRFVVDEHGGYLSTRTRRSWLDAYRGMHVLFGRQRDAVVDQIRRHLREGDGSWAL